MLDPLPPTFAATRDALHALAEHVVSAARYGATGLIGLRVTPGGFGTPEFDGQQVRVEGVELVHARGGKERRTFMTTLHDAAEFVGVPLGAPDVYETVTHVDPNAPLPIDATAARVLADWLVFVQMHLDRLGGDDASEVQLWPEHFDLATEFGANRATYGGSPGDDLIPKPYLYVAPWDEAIKTRFGDYTFGRALLYSDLLADSDAAEAFFTTAVADLA